jgi:hypothetical protein
MKKIVYPFSFSFSKNSKTLIWIPGDDNQRDHFLKQDDGDLLEIKTENGLAAALDGTTILWEEEAKCDLDKFFSSVKRLSHRVKSSRQTCIRLLDGWNFLEDLAYTFDLPRDLPIFNDEDVARFYMKVFYGNNLPSMTPEGCQFAPVWTAEEVVKFKFSIRQLWRLIIKKSPALVSDEK